MDTPARRQVLRRAMWLLSGIMIADPVSEWTLSALERRTKMGHGLANTVDDNAMFPASELVYLRESGFLPAYLKFVGWTKAELASARPTNQRATDAASLSPRIGRSASRSMILFGDFRSLLVTTLKSPAGAH